MTLPDTFLTEQPRWQRRIRARLAVSMALASLLLAAAVFVVRFDSGADAPPMYELTVVLPVPEPDPAPEQVVTTVAEPPSAEPREEPPVSPETAAEMPEQPAPKRDWYSQLDEVVKATVAQQRKPSSVNPGFDAKRSKAAAKFAPPQAPRSRPIWENVETDQMGRKILVSGDCHRVVDDPSAVNNEIFRTFGQYIVYCARQKSGPSELPWVDDIRDRYDYLARQGDANDTDRSDMFARLQ